MILNLHGAEVERFEQAGALSRVTARARRRAVRAGDAEIDSGHLLHALLECDDRVLALAAPLPAQATRLMGYLAQRSIGFGRAWSAGEGASTLHRPVRQSAPLLSDSASAALQRALLAALMRHAAQPDVLDLLAELVSDPECRAAEMLAGAGVDPLAVATRARDALRDGPPGASAYDDSYGSGEYDADAPLSGA